MKINVIVKTNANKNEIVGFDEEKNSYIVNVKALPEKGKANYEIIKLFTKKYKKSAKIVSGFTSKKKVIEVKP